MIFFKWITGILVKLGLIWGGICTHLVSFIKLIFMCFRHSVSVVGFFFYVLRVYFYWVKNIMHYLYCMLKIEFKFFVKFLKLYVQYMYYKIFYFLILRGYLKCISIIVNRFSFSIVLAVELYLGVQCFILVGYYEFRIDMIENRQSDYFFMYVIFYKIVIWFMRFSINNLNKLKFFLYSLLEVIYGGIIFNVGVVFRNIYDIFLEYLYLIYRYVSGFSIKKGDLSHIKNVKILRDSNNSLIGEDIVDLGSRYLKIGDNSMDIIMDLIKLSWVDETSDDKVINQKILKEDLSDCIRRPSDIMYYRELLYNEEHDILGNLYHKRIDKMRNNKNFLLDLYEDELGIGIPYLDRYYDLIGYCDKIEDSEKKRVIKAKEGRNIILKENLINNSFRIDGVSFDVDKSNDLQNLIKKLGGIIENVGFGVIGDLYDNGRLLQKKKKGKVSQVVIDYEGKVISLKDERNESKYDGGFGKKIYERKSKSKYDA